MRFLVLLLILACLSFSQTSQHPCDHHTNIAEHPSPCTSFVYSDFYVDVAGGNDINDGLTSTSPWLTTHDSLALTNTQAILYLQSGTWYLYRETGMTANEASLTADLVTATADTF